MRFTAYLDFAWDKISYVTQILEESDRYILRFTIPEVILHFMCDNSARPIAGNRINWHV